MGGGAKVRKGRRFVLEVGKASPDCGEERGGGTKSMKTKIEARKKVLRGGEERATVAFKYLSSSPPWRWAGRRNQKKRRGKVKTRPNAETP